MFKKDGISLSHRLQRIILLIHQYTPRILFKPGAQPFIADWLSRHNHKIGKDQEIPGMDISIKIIETCMIFLECMTTEEI